MKRNGLAHFSFFFMPHQIFQSIKQVATLKGIDRTTVYKRQAAFSVAE